jgi:hypothetical protein
MGIIRGSEVYLGVLEGKEEKAPMTRKLPGRIAAELIERLLKRRNWAELFRRCQGRDPTRADLERILDEEFGIKPDAGGIYHRSQFEPLWKQMEKPQ